MMTPEALHEMALALEESGEYRVLRRLRDRSCINLPDGSDLRLGIVIDIETTGLDPKQDEIIELAMVPFTFSADGRIFEVREAFHSLCEPSKPIPAEITALTGIDDAMVKGHFYPFDVARIVEPAAIVIAHNAGFDRPFAERFSNAFKPKRWACSMSEIDWKAEGLESVRLAWLLSQLGWFYQRHRSASDCAALIELLASPLPKSGVTALSALLSAARQSTCRIWALDSPFATKDVLKARGYRWSAGEGNWPKSWYLDTKGSNQDDEIAFLRREIYRRENQNFRIDKLTAFDRFSERTMP